MNPLTIDNIKNQIASFTDKKEKIDFINQTFYSGGSISQEELMKMAETNLLEASELGYIEGVIGALLNLGMFNSFLGKPKEAIEKVEEALLLAQEINYPKGIAESYSRLGSLFWTKGDFDNAFDLAYQSLQITEEHQLWEEEAWSRYGLGHYHMELDDLVPAKDHFIRAYELFQNYKRPTDGIGRSLNGLAILMDKNGDHKQALYYAEQALEIHQKNNAHEVHISRSLNDLGQVHLHLKNFDKAYNYLNQACKIRSQNNSLQAGLITTLMLISQYHQEQKEYDLAIEKVNQAIDLSQKLEAGAKLYKAYELAAMILEEVGRHKESIEFYKKFYSAQMKVLGDQSSIKLKNLQSKYEIQRTEQEKEIYRLKNQELRRAYDAIDAQNKTIRESIDYAQRIQETILPPLEEIQEVLSKSFIFFKPRDIVSGDFYWMAQPTKDLTFIATIDCTGHGVPGAFMTMMANVLLNNIVLEKKTCNPAEILYQLDKEVRDTKRGNQFVNDGMDIALCKLNWKEEKLTFAGAKQPLIFIRDNKMTHIKGSKYAIGSNQFADRKIFENHCISYEEGDFFYLYSDGFQDQFGGAQNRKYMAGNFKGLLYGLYQKPVMQQQRLLEDEFQKWRGYEEQTDDVLIIGFGL